MSLIIIYLLNQDPLILFLMWSKREQTTARFDYSNHSFKSGYMQEIMSKYHNYLALWYLAETEIIVFLPSSSLFRNTIVLSQIQFVQMDISYTNKYTLLRWITISYQLNFCVRRWFKAYKWTTLEDRDGSQGPRPCTTPNIVAYSTSFLH